MSKESISQAVQLLCQYREDGDDEIIERLVQGGIERPYATRLVLFLPLIYSRLILRKLGIQFSMTYRTRLDAHSSREKLLASEPVWTEVEEYASDHVGDLSRDERLWVAGRSPEFKVVNAALNTGADAANFVLPPPVFWWAEEQH
jgi:hypothetical protein